MGDRRLICFDLEGTLFRDTELVNGDTHPSAWRAIAGELGEEARRANHRLVDQWRQDELESFSEWVDRTAAIHQEHGLTRSTFEHRLDAMVYRQGIGTVLDELVSRGHVTAIISGGFKYLAERVQRDHSIHHSFTACEYLWGDDGALQGWNIIPCDFENKPRVMQMIADEYGLSMSDCAFIGDGMNDRFAFEAAGYTVSIGGDEQVRTRTDHDIDPGVGMGRLIDVIDTAWDT